MYSTQNKNMFASILTIFTCLVSVAQGATPPPPAAPEPPGLPIDEGIVILFVLALSYGVYKALKFSKKTA